MHYGNLWGGYFFQKRAISKIEKNEKNVRVEINNDANDLVRSPFKIWKIDLNFKKKRVKWEELKLPKAREVVWNIEYCEKSETGRMSPNMKNSFKFENWYRTSKIGTKPAKFASAKKIKISKKLRIFSTVLIAKIWQNIANLGIIIQNLKKTIKKWKICPHL